MDVGRSVFPSIEHPAFREWTERLGPAYVSTQPQELAEAEAATFLTSQKIHVILHPGSLSQVQACLEIAHRHRVSIYPISRGRNCGYGSRVPYVSGAALDLRRLNQISNYDPELGVVTIEPGVTQEQLATFLLEQGRKHVMDPVATFPDCSVLANILERGHGTTAAGDRISSACDYEIVLAPGKILRTGYSAWPGARAVGLDRWAAGPQIDGLFSQSNFGVVTRMTVGLMPRPENFRLLALPVESDEEFVRLIDVLRPLRLAGTLRFGPRFFNDHRLLQTFSDYPWEAMAGETPISDAVLDQRRRALGIPHWSCVVGFHGSRRRIDADEADLREVLESAGFRFSRDVVVIDEEKKAAPGEELGQKFESVFQQFARANYEMMCGRVSPVTQRPRWRQRAKAVVSSPDWSRDRCGIIWCPMTAPFRGQDILAAVRIYRDTLTRFGFEPDMSVSVIRERTAEINVSIVFDRHDPRQERNAVACADEVLRELAIKGFFPHRMGLPTMQLIEMMDPEVRELWRDLRRVFDPHGVLSSGRYVRSADKREN